MGKLNIAALNGRRLPGDRKGPLSAEEYRNEEILERRRIANSQAQRRLREAARLADNYRTFYLAVKVVASFSFAAILAISKS